MVKRIFVVALLMACCGAVLAGNTRAARKQVEASMMVTGTIDVDANGRVAGYALEHEDAYPPGVLQLLARSTPTWVFEPVLVDGQPRPARAPMRLRLVAQKMEGDEDRYEISIRSAWFGSEAEPDPATRVRGLEMTPPTYPEWARRSGISGTVYLLMKVGGDGSVEESIAEQTNLTVIGPENLMQRWRRDLERTALNAARKWTFQPPTDPVQAAKGHWIVRVPVSFKLYRDGEDRQAPAPGQWQSYVTGPRQFAPWMPRDEVADMGVDAGLPNGIQQLGTGLRLLTGFGAG